jgi:hypothetical protein
VAGPVIAGAAILLLGIGVMYFRSRATQSDESPVTTAPPAATAAETPVFDAPPPPPPPPPEPSASAEPADVKTVRRGPPAGCAGPCEGAEPPGLQGQLAAKAGLSRRCYERALMHNPTLQGRMMVSLRVGPNGVVCHANVTQNELGDAGVASCVAQIFRSSSFVAPQGGCVEAQVPIKFSPKG